MSVDYEPIQADIDRLNSIRVETRIWSVGSFVAVFAILAGGIGVVATSAKHLFEPGSAQDEFVADLGRDLNSNVTPSLQTIASQALTESQPAIQTQFVKLGTRVPDVSNAFIEQFNQLQQELPKRGDAVVDATFGQVLVNLEPKIKTMYPGVTDQAISQLVGNVTDESESQFAEANNKLFAKHEAVFKGITQDIETIRESEPVSADEDKANLDMAISVIEAFHSDLTSLNDTNVSSAKGVSKS